MKINKKILIAFLLTFSSVTLVLGVVFGEIYFWIAIPSLSGVVLGWLIPKNIEKIQDCLDTKKWQPSLRKLWRGKILKRDSLIRISFAYLFRIQVDGKYFLVKNGRGTQKYQPVGGAYKYNKTEKRILSSEFQIVYDKKIPIDDSSRDDYRFFVHSKDLKAFVKHFDATTERERVNDLGREFKEEMIQSKIVDFTHIEYRYCGRHFTEVLYSRHFQCYELLMADVVELLLTKEQEDKLRVLMTQPSEEYHFATSEEIKSLGVVENSENLKESISDHTFKILQETEYELENRDTSKEIFSVDL